MTFDYFCRQLTDSSTLTGEPWGTLNENELTVSDANSGIEVLFEESPDQGLGGCFGTGFGTTTT